MELARSLLQLSQIEVERSQKIGLLLLTFFRDFLLSFNYDENDTVNEQLCASSANTNYDIMTNPVPVSSENNVLERPGNNGGFCVPSSDGRHLDIGSEEFVGGCISKPQCLETVQHEEKGTAGDVMQKNSAVQSRLHMADLTFDTHVLDREREFVQQTGNPDGLRDDHLALTYYSMAPNCDGYNCVDSSAEYIPVEQISSSLVILQNTVLAQNHENRIVKHSDLAEHVPRMETGESPTNPRIVMNSSGSLLNNHLQMDCIESKQLFCINSGEMIRDELENISCVDSRKESHFISCLETQVKTDDLAWWSDDDDVNIAVKPVLKTKTVEIADQSLNNNVSFNTRCAKTSKSQKYTMLASDMNTIGNVRDIENFSYLEKVSLLGNKFEAEAEKDTKDSVCLEVEQLSDDTTATRKTPLPRETSGCDSNLPRNSAEADDAYVNISQKQDICDKILPNKSTFYCPECQMTFMFLSKFQKHKRDGQCKFECLVCKKTFMSRNWSSYQAHLRWHNNDKPFKCTECDKSYKFLSDLNSHKLIHSGERPFTCYVCSASFTKQKLLKAHIKRKHSERQNFKCDLCDSVFSNMPDLKQHLKYTHSSERPFICHVCNKCYKSKPTLNIHLLTHGEAREFSCHLCQKSFKLRGTLRCHMIRHLKQYSVYCDVCGKGCYDNKKLKEHQRTHSGEKPFSCTVCNFKCAIAGNLKKHMKIHDREATMNALVSTEKPCVSFLKPISQISPSQSSGISTTFTINNVETERTDKSNIFIINDIKSVEEVCAPSGYSSIKTSSNVSSLLSNEKRLEVNSHPLTFNLCSSNSNLTEIYENGVTYVHDSNTGLTYAHVTNPETRPPVLSTGDYMDSF